jgi:mannose-6-phosphate isomerase
MKLAKHLVEKPWGRTDVPAEFGDVMGRQIGEVWFEAPDGAPLPILVKWLFTSEKLSIQVHPNDTEARARGEKSGKEECWYIVRAEPGAVLGIGTKQALSVDELRAASLDGSIEALMDWKPVKAGDYFYIPAGTVHAIGEGITLVEVQEYADITYRLYDYGRPRELHLDDGAAVSQARPYADNRSGSASGNMQLAYGAYFRLWLVSDQDGLDMIPDKGRRWIVPLNGAITIGADLIRAGECLLVEADITVTLDAGSQILVAIQ